MGNGKWEITMEKSGQRSFGSRATTPDFFGDGGMQSVSFTFKVRVFC